MSTLSPIAVALYDRINAATSPDELASLQDAIWRRHWGVDLNDAEAQFLTESVQGRKPHQRPVTINALNARISRFKSRQHPRSPDRKASRERRRTLGSSSSMPPVQRAMFTEGQRAVLAIVAGEVKHHGACELPYDAIAAKAGVCRTTVQTAMHEARRLGLIYIAERPRPGRKNLTNVIRIVSREWRTWLARGPTVHRPSCIGSNSLNLVSPTKSTDLNREEALQERHCGKVPMSSVQLGKR